MISVLWTSKKTKGYFFAGLKEEKLSRWAAVGCTQMDLTIEQSKGK